MTIDKKLIKGEWLKRALDSIGVTPYQVAKGMNIKPDKFYRHIQNSNFLSAESLAELAQAYPRINLHYILTGEGSPLL